MLNSIPKSKLNAKEQKLLEQMHEFMIYNQQLLNLNHKAVHQTRNNIQYKITRYQGSKTMINKLVYCTSPMNTHKITLSVEYN